MDSDLDRLKRSADNAMRGARRAELLTQRLLAFSRQQPLEPKAIDVGRLVTGMSDLLRRTLGEQIAVETVLAGGLWRAMADPNQLEVAIVNLAVNARDAMPKGGKLTIETANVHLDDRYASAQVEVLPGQYVLLAVTDNGVGMPPDVKAKAFDPFFTTKDVGHGTGLGLSQVYGFVKQSRGHVKIYSEAGEGTTVKIYLPRYLGALRRDGRRDCPGPSPAEQAGKQFWSSRMMRMSGPIPLTACAILAIQYSKHRSAPNRSPNAGESPKSQCYLPISDCLAE